MKNALTLILLLALVPLLLLAMAPGTSLSIHDNDDDDDDDGGGTVVVEGVAVTGFNRLLSQPIWDLGAPFGPAGFNFVYAYNPGGDDPIDLTDATPGSTLIASGVDPNYLVAFGITEDDFDPDLANVPFRDVATIVDPTGGRAQVPSVLDVPGFVPSKSLPNDPLTLDDWLSARGTLKYTCNSDGTADIRINARNLIVNGVYTIWGVFKLDTDNNGTPDTIIPVALGGVPNVFIADKNGKGKIARTINLCPDEETSLLNIDVAYHSDGIVYGALPELPLGGLPGGLATHDQINFPIHVAGTVAARTGETAETPGEAASFELHNFPNPSNPTTTIAYSLPAAAQVRVTVYNALGQEVQRLVDTQQEAGRHEVVFDARALSSGTYFYRLDTPSGSQVKKFVIVK